MTKKKQVRMSNKAVKGRYSLTAEEQRFIMLVISQIQPEDEDFKDYKLHISDIAEACEAKKKHSRFKDFAKKLMGRVIQIDEQDEILTMNWFSHIKYIKGTGVIECSISPMLKPYLLKLQNRYTSANLEHLLKFKSKYASRLYLVLKADYGAQYKPTLEIEYGVGDMAKKFDLPEAYKKRYSDFKSYFLLPCLKEINEITDLTIDYEEIKPSRKIEAIKFTVSSKESSKNQQSRSLDQRLSDTVESLLGAHGVTPYKMQYINTWGLDVGYIRKVVKYIPPNDLDHIINDMLMSNYDAMASKKAVFISKCEAHIKDNYTEQQATINLDDLNAHLDEAIKRGNILI